MKLTRKVLHQRAKPVQFQYPVQNRQLEQQLFEFMRQERAIGLAATQVGIRSRVFVMDIEGQTWACFNPTIKKTSTILTDFTEGCLSFKGDQCTITRPEEIAVSYQDFQGNQHDEVLSGLAARCFQHELDHLNGVTMWDRYKEQNAEQSRD